MVMTAAMAAATVVARMRVAVMSVELSAVMMGPMVMTAAMAAATVVARMRAAAMAAAMAVRVVANVVAAHNGSQSFPSPLCGTC